jgi:serine/threonine protein kinase
MALKLSKAAPQVIGKFQIVKKLGSNQTVNVFQGRNPTTGEEVAIKLANERIVGDPVLLKRFEKEFAVARGLNHPHLVRALHYGHHGSTPYIVFEFVNGPSLGDRIEAEKQLPVEAAVRIIAQVAEGLTEAHKKRIIHRDVKPDNILLTAEGEAKLADLGLAKDIDAETLLTRPATGLGTPNFIAPEQFSDAKNADVRCDIYALGATLYMAVTGQLPFHAKGVLGILRKKLANDIAPPRQWVPDLNERVERAILRSLDANPRERHASCQRFLDDLFGKDSRPYAAKVAPLAASYRAKQAAGERRATIRYPSKQEGACQAVGSEKELQWSAKLLDVSADGIGLVVNRRFEPRTVLLMDLPQKCGDHGRRFLVRVVRAEQLSARAWLIGCVFARRLNDEDREALC